MAITELDRNENNLDTIYEHIKILADLNIDDYQSLETQEGDSLNLENLVPGIRRTTRCFIGIQKSDLEMFPKSRLYELVDVIYRVEDFLNRVQNPNSTQTRDNVNEREGELSTLYDEIHPVIGQVKLHSISPDNSEMQSILNHTKIDSQSIKEMEKEATKLLETLRNYLKREGVSNEAKPFNDVIQKHRSHKRWWGISFGFFIACIIGTGFWLFLGREIPIDNVSLTLSHLLTRMTILGALWYAAYFCNRNYRVAAHQQIINERCKNSLDSFQVFVDGASDQAVKDAILRTATETIFSHQPTGFGQRETVHPNSILVNLLGEVTGKD